MDATQIDVRRNTADFQNFREVFGLRFQNNEVADWIKRLVFDGRQPATMGVSPLVLASMTCCQVRFAPAGSPAFQINSRQMQTERRGFVGFILRRNKSEGFVFVAGMERFLFLRYKVFVVISAPPPAEHAVSLFHFMSHVVNMSHPKGIR